jgi:hypothetical protein
VTPEAADVLDKPEDSADTKQEDPATPGEDDKKEEPVAPAEDDPANPQDPAASNQPETPAEPKPLTEEGVLRILQQARQEERASTNEMQNATKDVMDAYYPEGLSNVLVDQSTGKELRTPQDVVDAAGGDMSMEAAAQWLMNEQYKLDSNIAKIKEDAAKIAETTVNFKRDSIAVLNKYSTLFKAYPQLQTKAFDLMMKQVKADETKGVILQAPDVMDLYDTYLEPYKLAYEYSTQQPATNPVAPATPPAPTPGLADRMDEGGDAGASPVDDPNDFAQQVTKELTRGF